MINTSLEKKIVHKGYTQVSLQHNELMSEGMKVFEIVYNMKKSKCGERREIEEIEIV